MCINLISNPVRGFMATEATKTFKITKIFKNLKIAKIRIIFVFIFAVPKDIAHKMVRKSNFILQKTFINYNRRESKNEHTWQIAGK